MNSSSKKSFGMSETSSLRGSTMRANSITSGPIKTQSNFSKKGGSVKGNDSDNDIEPLEMMPEREELREVLEEVERKQKRAKDAHKHNFLHRYLDNIDKTI